MGFFMTLLQCHLTILGKMAIPCIDFLLLILDYFDL